MFHRNQGRLRKNTHKELEAQHNSQSRILTLLGIIKPSIQGLHCTDNEYDNDNNDNWQLQHLSKLCTNCRHTKMQKHWIFFLGYTKHKVLGKSPLLFFSQTGPDHIKDGILNYTQMQYETKGAKKPMGVMRLKSLSKKYNCKDVSQSRTVPSTLKYFISF